MTTFRKHFTYAVTSGFVVLTFFAVPARAQALDGTPTVNTFLFASHIVEVRCEGPTGVSLSNCVGVKADGSTTPVYRVPQDMYLIVTGMDWRPSAAGGGDFPGSKLSPNFGAVLVNADGTVRAYWDVPRFDNAIHLYPTSGIVLPPNFQPSVCQGSLTDVKIAGCPGLNNLINEGRMVFRGYLSPK